MLNASDIKADHMLSLSKAAKLFPTDTGKAVSLVSMRRWITQGVRGVRLAATYSAGRWWTTREAVEAFQVETTRRRLAAGVAAPVRSSDTTKYLRDRHGI